MRKAANRLNFMVPEDEFIDGDEVRGGRRATPCLAFGGRVAVFGRLKRAWVRWILVRRPGAVFLGPHWPTCPETAPQNAVFWVEPRTIHCFSPGFRACLRYVGAGSGARAGAPGPASLHPGPTPPRQVVGLGTLGRDAASGRLRVQARQQKIRLTTKAQKKLARSAAGRVGGGAVSGLASSLAFTPVQGIELEDPAARAAAAEDAGRDGTESYFSALGGFRSAAKPPGGGA